MQWSPNNLSLRLPFYFNPFILLLYLRLFFVMLHSYALTSKKYNGYLENHLFLYFISAPELIISIACEQQRALITSSAGRVFLCPRARFETNQEEVRREFPVPDPLQTFHRPVSLKASNPSPLPPRAKKRSSRSTNNDHPLVV